MSLVSSKLRYESHTGPRSEHTKHTFRRPSVCWTFVTSQKVRLYTYRSTAWKRSRNSSARLLLENTISGNGNIALAVVISVVEVIPSCKVSRELEVLPLVLSCWDEVRSVEQDIRGHEDGIRHQSGPHVFPLCHTAAR